MKLSDNHLSRRETLIILSVYATNAKRATPQTKRSGKTQASLSVPAIVPPRPMLAKTSLPDQRCLVEPDGSKCRVSRRYCIRYE